MSSLDRWASGSHLSIVPAELMAAIVEWLPLKDIVSLAKTSRLMHQRMIPFMYQELEIYKRVFPWERDSQGLDLKKYQRTFFQDDASMETLSIFHFVKDLRILAKPWLLLRCPLARYLAGRGHPRDEPQDNVQHNCILEAFSLIARQAFSNLCPGKLSHFSWLLGYCMPEEVLGLQGYITINQTNLKSLSLTVDGSCPGRGLAGLALLNNLHHFSWRGVVTQRNFNLFCKVVENNAHNLVSLSVEVARRAGAQRSLREVYLDLIWLGLLVPSDRHFARFARARSVRNEFRLNKLVSLSLRNVSLIAWRSDDILTFDPAKLITLTLDFCPKTLRFLETWNTINSGLSLRSFHGMIDELWGWRRSFPLDDLLRKHGSRLEELYLSITDNFAVDIDFGLYQPCLKRMILSFLRQRLMVRTESALPDAFSVRTILQELPGLEGFAFCRSPQFLRKFLRHDAGPFPNLKVIHFRSSKMGRSSISSMVDYSLSTKIIIDSIKQYERYETLSRPAVMLSELVDFAAWAFDCTAFPNINIIAMGDFSEAYAGVVLRRREDLPRYSLGSASTLMKAYKEYRKIDSAPMIPFEFLNPHDPCSWEGMEKCREMIWANSPHEPWAGHIIG